ncbi:Melanoma-associated antigen D2 [Orchesella cincta]|uniref:Melanoma-associated antigen D2 n=1 Tax=Orchesella cincta TaxID=48709 RepID=A0A1D2MH29_ORCCI|nr:Melanoma-associated antigen D2 [Orchesella cincta]
MSWRRSTRIHAQAKRPRFQDGTDENVYPSDVHHQASVGDMMMAGGSWQMGHHHLAAAVDSFHNMGMSSYHHQYPHYQTQYHGVQHQPQYQQYHHPVEMSQGMMMPTPTMMGDAEPGTSSGRSLRNRAGPSTSTPIISRGKRIGAPSSQLATAASSSGEPSGSGRVASVLDDAEDDEDDVEGGTASGTPKAKKGGMETSLTVDQMVHNCLYYLLVSQHKKVPVKRSDLIKNAMNSQAKSFSDVIKKLSASLDEVFGMKLVRLEKGKEHLTVASTPTDDEPGDEKEDDKKGKSKGKVDEKKGKGKGKGNSSSVCMYMVVSKFPSSVCDSVMKRDPEVDSKKTVLYLVLSTIFMLNRAIDEDLIWKIIQEMQLDQIVCQRREDLRKFLKSEFVSTGYLNMEVNERDTHPNAPKKARDPSSNDQNDKPEYEQATARYLWGPRAHVEYSKYAMLKFVTNRFPGRRPYEFTVQYNVIKQDEKEKGLLEEIIEERESDNDHASAAAGRNGSALRVKPKTKGKEPAYAIDTGGDNTETETEVE